MAIPVETKNEVMIGRSTRSEVCGMEMNASVVKAVTSTLYNYKIDAVVREYATNITDSHNDSGKEGLKGYIHVPTKMNPVIEFHDYGLGMTEDTIYSVYTVLGKSTKRGDNSTNGSLGFGSKSYGTVCDQMTVTSVKDGTKVVVVCYKDRTGMLAADTKSITKTDQQNGTVVSIPVKLNEVDLWQEISAKVLGAFRVPHEVNSFGEYDNVFLKMKELCDQVREEGTVFLHSNTKTTENLRSSKYVLMGDVIYELPDFNTLLPNLKIKNIISKVTNSGFYMTSFSIGDLDHAPSRESISYDDQTFFKVKTRVKKDVINHLKDFKEKLGSLEDMSYYKFRKEFENTEVYTAISEVQLPFLKGYSLNQVCPRFTGDKWFKPLMFLSNEDIFGKIKGMVPSSAYEDYIVYSGVVNSFDQKRLFAIKNPLIIYSNNERGLYKVKDTLENIKKSTGITHLLVTDDKEKAENILHWMGGGEVICGDKFSPAKPVKGERSKINRKSYGVKEDWETLGQVYTLRDNGYSSCYEKVDLSEEGVYYWKDEGANNRVIEVSGIVKGKITFLTMYTSLAKVLFQKGVRKIVVVNSNNKGKIKRSQVNNISGFICDIVKPLKKDIIKHTVWNRHTNSYSNRYDTPLLVKCKSVSKIKQRQEGEFSSFVKTLCEVSDFSLKDTPAYKKEVTSRDSLYSKVLEEVEVVKSKLPLWDEVKYSTEDKIQHYLRLEKVIK